MALYQGKYRRTCCATRQPAREGNYLCWYRKSDKNKEVVCHWNGKEWMFSNKHPNQFKTSFGNIKSMLGMHYWAPIPNDYF